MHQEEKILFSLLKREIAATMMRSYPGIDPEISNWKGQNITDFQEELRTKVNGQLSEKWFYTHMKSENSSLPRIDVLNMLSQYAGYFNWQDFRHKMAGTMPMEGKQAKPVSILIKIALLFIMVIVLLFIIIKLINTQNYHFTFIDSDTGEPVPDANLRVELLMEGSEYPKRILPDEKGSVMVRTNKNRISMIVRAPYYLTDTVERTLRKFKHTEQVSLNADYYALMISFFSRSDVTSWEKRRKQLDGIFSEDAIIYQFPEKNAGEAMALFNKWEFIDKITMPSSGLRQIEILDCRYLDGKISVLRFRIKPDKE
ncbi:MAG: hypothetical protein A2Y71_11965 [Bacteroidetes bacterium RBG_13_42_15]|nr:MAG: hypothetical protein A2Y71_11965 [Bacteroidetes bacterium RBG_13_42_15]